MVGGWTEGTDGAADPRTVLPHLGVCRSDAGLGGMPAAACGASWSGGPAEVPEETPLTGSSGTAGLDAAGVHLGLLGRPGCKVGKCQCRRVLGGAGGRWSLGVPRADGC